MGVNHVFLIIVISANFVFAGNYETYSGYSVHGVQLRDEGNLKVLYDLQKELGLVYWQYGAPGLRDAVVMVSPENSARFLDQLDENEMTHYLHLADVAKGIQEHEKSITNWKQRRNNRMLPFEDYPRHDEVNAYMERLATQYPDLVTIVTAGPSFEGRPIKYLKISTTNFTDTSKPVYFMDAMLHGAEWVTTPVTLYAAHRLVEDLRDGDQDLLENVDWIVMPLVNADGYEYSHTNERLWRHTRSFYPAVNTLCYGVDANRNFNYSFNTLGVFSDPCHIMYPGHEPFSEAETRYVRDVLLEYQDRIQLYLDIHSFGSMILFAYGDKKLPPNAAHLHHTAAAMGAAIDAVNLPGSDYYLVGNSAMVLYYTSGTAQDYAQSVGIPFVFTLELPSFGYWFMVPPEYLPQINMETWEGIAASARIAVTHYRARRN